MRVAQSGRKSISGRGNSVGKGEGGMNGETGRTPLCVIDIHCYVYLGLKSDWKEAMELLFGNPSFASLPSEVRLLVFSHDTLILSPNLEHWGFMLTGWWLRW